MINHCVEVTALNPAAFNKLLGYSFSGFKLEYSFNELKIQGFWDSTLCSCGILTPLEVGIPVRRSAAMAILERQCGAVSRVLDDEFVDILALYYISSQKMSFKGIVRELKEMKHGIGNLSLGRTERKNWLTRTRSHVVPDQATALESVEQGSWAFLPPELLLDIIKRVEESEIQWPARTVITSCASVCKSWREVTKEIVQAPEQCGRLTFPISLMQPGSRESPMQCFIRRDRATSTFCLFFGQTPSEDESEKLLLAAKKMRRATNTVFVISLVSGDFSRASYTYVGKLRSNFLGSKFTLYDSQSPIDSAVKQIDRSSRRFNSKQASVRLPACNYRIATISYELNILRTRGPRRLQCVMNSIPFSSIQEGGKAPTPKSLPRAFEYGFSSQVKEPENSSKPSLVSEEPLILKNKAPRWHEQLQCWCLNFRGRVTVASVKNFQLVASVESHHNVSASEQEKVILQFGKIGKDIFTMDYHYPLSAFQAFAICLSSFDTKPACE